MFFCLRLDQCQNCLLDAAGTYVVHHGDINLELYTDGVGQVADFDVSQIRIIAPLNARRATQVNASGDAQLAAAVKADPFDCNFACLAGSVLEPAALRPGRGAQHRMVETLAAEHDAIVDDEIGGEVSPRLRRCTRHDSH